MRSFIIIFLSLFFSGHVFAERLGTSAVRNTDETYEAARNRHLFEATFRVTGPRLKQRSINRAITAERAKKSLINLNLTEIPDVGSYADLENQFKYVRDTRFIETKDPSFPRRLTWLYPDDGCYARAEMAKLELMKQNFPAPKKLFVFGNLYAQSGNSPSGGVQWWYHVAVTYRVGADVYVIDPALEPARPLKLMEWNALVNGESTRVQYSICAAETYDPTSDCYGSEELPADETLREQRSFLQDEWNRLLELNRLPEKELGDLPPWLTN